MRDSVLAFVVNDYGEACYNYFKRSRDERYRELARAEYLRSAELDPFYAIPRHNLFLLNKEEGSDKAERDAEDLERIEPDWFEAKLAIMWKRARDASRAQLAADAMDREWRGKLRKSARLEATAEERNASVYAAQQPAAHRSTLYTKPQEARSRNVEAGQLVQDAGALWRRQQELLREAREHKQQAECVLRELVPHQWLWRGRVRGSLTPEKVLRSPARRWRLDREWRWEREFDNVHVKALYDWGVALLSPGVRKSPSDRIFAHIEEHFWQDNFQIVHHFRRQVDRRIWDAVVDLRVPLRTIWATRAQGLDARRARLRLAELLDLFSYSMTRLPLPRLRLGDVELRYQGRIDKYNEILAGTVLARVDEDPTAFWALSWLNDGLQTVTRSKAAQLSFRYTTLDSTERLKRLLDVLRNQSPASPALYRWLGEQLTALREELENRRELGQKLQKAARAIRDGDQVSATGIRDDLENCDWRGLEGSALKEYRRALKARDPDELARIALRLEHPLGDGSGDPQAAIDALKRYEIDAYELALESEDPEVRLRVAEALRLLGERDRSERALRAYGRTIRGTVQPSALWRLAEGYREFGDWRRARQTFQRAQQADERRVASGRGPRWRDGDQYRWEIARALWGEGQHHQALDELDLTTGEPEARTRFVGDLLNQDAIPSLEAYRTLRTWLERHQRAGANPDAAPSRRDAGRALFELALARRRPQDGATAWSAADQFGGAEEMLPVVAPVVLHAEPSLFPDLGPEAPQAKRVMDAYAGMLDRIREELGVRIPGMLIRPGKVLPGRELPLQRHQYLVMLHEVPLASGVATRVLWEQDAVSAGIEPTVRRYLDTYLGFTEAQELLAVTRAEAQLAADRSDEAERLAGELASGTDDRRLRLVQVLQRLVREGVPVIRLGSILDELDRYPSRDVGEVADRLRPTLLEPPPRSAAGIRLGPEWEAAVERWVQNRAGRPFLAVPTEDEPDLQRLLGLIARHIRTPGGTVLVVPDDLRRFVGHLTAGFPLLRVLGSREWPGSSSQLPPLAASQPETVG